MLIFTSGRQSPRFQCCVEGVSSRRACGLMVWAQSRGLAGLGHVCVPSVDGLKLYQSTHPHSQCVNEFQCARVSGCCRPPSWVLLPREWAQATKAVLLTPPLTAVLSSLLSQLHSLELQGELRAPLSRCCAHQTNIVPSVMSQSHRVGNSWMHRHRSVQRSNGDSTGQHTGGRSPHTDLQTAAKYVAVAFRTLGT